MDANFAGNELQGKIQADASIVWSNGAVWQHDGPKPPLPGPAPAPTTTASCSAAQRASCGGVIQKCIPDNCGGYTHPSDQRECLNNCDGGAAVTRNCCGCILQDYPWMATALSPVCSSCTKYSGLWTEECYGKPTRGNISLLVDASCNITATVTPKRSWSPASGTVGGTEVNMKRGFENQGSGNAAATTIRWAYGCTWVKGGHAPVPPAPPAPAPRPAPHDLKWVFQQNLPSGCDKSSCTDCHETCSKALSDTAGTQCVEQQWPGTAAAMGAVSASAGVSCHQTEAGDDPENPTAMNSGGMCYWHSAEPSLAPRCGERSPDEWHPRFCPCSAQAQPPDPPPPPPPNPIPPAPTPGTLVRYSSTVLSWLLLPLLTFLSSILIDTNLTYFLVSLLTLRLTLIGCLSCIVQHLVQ
jgi:hypothetical protein